MLINSINIVNKNTKTTSPIDLKYKHKTISSIPYALINKNNFNNTIKQDTFQKQSISFKGNNIYDILSEKAYAMYKDTDISPIEIVIYGMQEMELSYYIEGLSSKEIKSKMQFIKKMPIEFLHDFILADFEGGDISFIVPLLKEANINTIEDLNKFFRLYNNNNDAKKVFLGQDIEGIKIYGNLEDKEDFSKYPELLLYLYNEQSDRNEPDYTRLNEYTALLNRIGLNNFKELDKKFPYLKSQFNNFDLMSNKIEAIEYLKQNYDKQIEFLSKLLTENPNLKNKDAKKLFLEINDIVNYLYDENNGENLGILSDYIEYVANSEKLKTRALNTVADNFGKFKTPQDKLNFYNFLKENNTSVNEFNYLAEKTIISDYNPTLNIINKDNILNVLRKEQSIKQEDIDKIYREYNDVLNALYDENDNNLIKLFLNIISENNIKNTGQLLNYYNQASSDNKKSLTNEEIKNFIELFKYSNYKNITLEAKKQKTSVVKLLTAEKNKFLSVKDSIENVLQNDITGFYAGKNSFEVYSQNKTVISENPEQTERILQNIIYYNINDSEEYKEKAKEIDKFSKYFNDKNKLLKFISDNNIKFDGTKEDKEYIKDCLYILNTIYSDNSDNISCDLMKYYTESDFLLKSRIKLRHFINKLPDKETTLYILNLFAKKKVPSVKAFDDFFYSFKSPKSNGKELIDYLDKLPEDVDFERNFKILNSINSKLNELNIPCQINNTNIKYLDINTIKSLEDCSIPSIVYVANSILKTHDKENFLTSLKYSKNKSKTDYSAFAIALEIVERINKSHESYRNISKALKLDKIDWKNKKMYQVNIKNTEKLLPDEFIKFINSNDWLKYNEKNITPNLTLHARLRAIDRFALKDNCDLNNLYTKQTKQKLRSIFNSIYTTTPVNIEGTDETKRIVVDSKYENTIIESIFSQNGEMITLVEKSH